MELFRFFSPYFKTSHKTHYYNKSYDCHRNNVVYFCFVLFNFFETVFSVALELVLEFTL